MRLAAILFAGAFALLAHAETTTSVTPTTTDPATAAQNSAQASMLACINACKAGDVSCTSKCIAVPNPSASQVRTPPFAHPGPATIISHAITLPYLPTYLANFSEF